MKLGKKLGCLRAKRRLLVENNVQTMRESLHPTFSVYVTNIAFIVQSVQKKKKKGHKQVFQRMNPVWGILVS